MHETSSLVALLRSSRRLFEMKTIPLSAMMLLPLVYSLAVAQTYPLKPVRLVVPTAPGGRPPVAAQTWLGACWRKT